ncbi:uncharacterized protein KD926_011596 [Aspergillus affinis]|uniref:uncharacterized protein n=1 Tax=Aspergillus affinis TaxID=1070780 RepID=UPI0022FE9E13|nr:uncharacterized protein KD926_011596 [Aspergillus affinis]KAI9037807.1 hypothetical protein KD926_011596 [Aspergillus affinis]
MASRSANDSILHSPAATPPPGVQPNLDNPPNHGTITRAIIVTLWIVCSSLVLARMYIKKPLIRKVSLSDYAIILAWDFSVLLYYIHIAAITYGWCMMFIKSSILLQIIEVFVPIRQPNWFYGICLALIVANMIFYITGFFLELYSCQPRERIWTLWMEEGSCLDMIRLDLITASVNSASDFIMLILPQLRIWRLHMSWLEKVNVSAVFFVGILACTASILRLFYGIQYADSNNVSYYWFTSGLCSMIELAAGIIVARLPSMPRLFQKKGLSQGLSRIRLLLHGVFLFFSKLDMRPRFHSIFSSPGRLMRKRKVRTESVKSQASQTCQRIAESDQELPPVSVSREER